MSTRFLEQHVTADRTGGCLCGAIRFTLSAPPVHVSYCHCRMCRKATGGPYSVMATVPRGTVAWQHEPAWRRSSPLARRAFCAACGSPLGFEYDDSDLISIPIGAFDSAESLVPSQHGGIESRLPWVRVDTHLPEERCDDDADYRKLVAQSGWVPPFSQEHEA